MIDSILSFLPWITIILITIIAKQYIYVHIIIYSNIYCALLQLIGCTYISSSFICFLHCFSRTNTGLSSCFRNTSFTSISLEGLFHASGPAENMVKWRSQMWQILFKAIKLFYLWRLSWLPLNGQSTGRPATRTKINSQCLFQDDLWMRLCWLERCSFERNWMK